MMIFVDRSRLWYAAASTSFLPLIQTCQQTDKTRTMSRSVPETVEYFARVSRANTPSGVSQLSFSGRPKAAAFFCRGYACGSPLKDLFQSFTPTIHQKQGAVQLEEDWSESAMPVQRECAITRR